MTDKTEKSGKERRSTFVEFAKLDKQLHKETYEKLADE
jgi:hypothetical protein